MPCVGVKVISNCRHCGKEFTQPPCRLWRDKFCSSTCGYAHRASLLQQRVRRCATCGSEFIPRQIQLTKGQGKFCSQKCNTSGRAAMNSPQSQEKSKSTFRRKIQTKEIVVASGLSHWRWKGGEGATRKRRQASGEAAASLRKYRASHPEKVAEWGQSRRSANIGRVKRGTVARLLESQGRACGYCGAEIPPYHLDHKLPVCRGGTNAPENLHLTCPRCNMRKAAMTHDEFLVCKRRRVHKW